HVTSGLNCFVAKWLWQAPSNMASGPRRQTPPTHTAVRSTTSPVEGWQGLRRPKPAATRIYAALAARPGSWERVRAQEVLVGGGEEGDHLLVAHSRRQDLVPERQLTAAGLAA